MTESHTDVAVAPTKFSKMFPSEEILSSATQGWRNVTLQRHKASPGASALPPCTDHRIALQMTGTALFEGSFEGRYVRQWSTAGQSYVWPAGMSVTRTLTGEPQGLLIYLPTKFVDEAALQAFEQDAAHVHLVERIAVTDPVLDQLGRLLLREAEDASPATRLMVDSLSMALAVQLLRCHSNRAPRPMREAGLPSARLARVVEYMQANLSRCLELGELAGVGGLSAVHFTRAFRKACGETPHRYLVRLRIERARDLLRTTELAVTEIALQCGFEQSSHFATVFRQHIGASPRVWRMAQR